MKRFHRYSFPVAASALLAALALTWPRAVHAVAAVLVNVTNTASSPAIAEGVDRLALQNILLIGNPPAPLSIGQLVILRQQAPDGTISGSPFVVPAGQNLVVTNIEIVPGGSGPNSFNIRNFSNGNVRETLPNIPAGQLTQFQFATGIVFLAGESIAFVNAAPELFQGLIFLHGYLTSN